MAQNSKQSKLSEKGDECTFSWKVFASWDYGIANIETAHNKVASIKGVSLINTKPCRNLV